MNRTLRSLLAFVLAVLMLASISSTAIASVVRDDGSRKPETVKIDPSTLNVPIIGEDKGEKAGSAEEKAEFSPDEMVRVSIFLESPAAIDAGYSAKGIGTNTEAANYRKSIKNEQKRITESIEKAIKSDIKVEWNLTLAVNAISAEVRYGDIEKIRQTDGVKMVELENYYEAPKEEVSHPNTANTSTDMVGAVLAWDSGLGYTGAGSRIAMIDTGIDVNHQSFDSGAFDYAIAQTGKAIDLMTSVPSNLDLNGSGTYINSKIPYGYNYVDRNNDISHLNDLNGEHGSHVAGIAAANRFVENGAAGYVDAIDLVHSVGMAPDAQLLIMKVFGVRGGAYDSDYMAALEDAIMLDCDAANLSFGSYAPGYTYSYQYQEIFNSLVDKVGNEGMVVSISAGNAGAFDDAAVTPMYKDDVSFHTGGSPGTYINGMTVASADNIGETGTPLIFNGNQKVFYVERTESFEGDLYSNPEMVTIAGRYDFVYIDAVGEPENYSAINEEFDLTGKVVIVNRGSISFSEKGNNLIDYNPRALVVANNIPGTISMLLDDYTGTFPMVTISLANAEALKSNSAVHTVGDYTYYTGIVQVTNIPVHGSLITREEANVSDFSSWGAPGSLLMKPEITAPGGSIYSVAGTHVLPNGRISGGTDKYEIMSGTSMAAPHIAGLSAVVAQYLRENPMSAKNVDLSNNYTTREIIQSLLMSTATVMKPNGSYASVLQQGAGLVDVSRAINAATVIMMSAEDDNLTALTGAAADGKIKVELGDDPAKAGVYSYNFTVYNTSTVDLEFSLLTDLFTQGINGEFVTHETQMLPGGGVSYIWDGIASSIQSHDVDNDGDTDNDDAQAILDYLAGNRAKAVTNTVAADLDGDGSVTTYDAYLLIDWTPEASADGFFVPAGGSVDVTVNINLTDEQRAVLNEFENGAYIEGYTYVECITSDIKSTDYSHLHSIPILGFYGNWTDASMFDNTSYVDTLYGTDKTPYSGFADTNYVTYVRNGKTYRVVGNPYAIEDEFPEDRIALRSTDTLGSVYYNVLRSAGTTLFALSTIDEVGGNVLSLFDGNIDDYNVDGLYYNINNGLWQNRATRALDLYYDLSWYGIPEGSAFRFGYYAIPEYYAMKYWDDITTYYAGKLDVDASIDVLTSNVLGKGAYIGYDFTIDDTPPVIESTSLSGNFLNVTVSDNVNIAYVAVMSLNGDVKYAEAIPGTDSYTVRLNIADAITNANGYVAVYAGDYAANDSAVAVKVNDNIGGENQTVRYELAHEIEDGSEYLIVNSCEPGAAYALSYTTQGTVYLSYYLASDAVTIENDGTIFIDEDCVDNNSVWTYTSTSTGGTFSNNGVYLRRSNNTASASIQISASVSYNTWVWDGASDRLGTGNGAYMVAQNNTFAISSSAQSIYLYKKIVTGGLDPTAVSDVAIDPDFIEIYKGSIADLEATVMPLTASDRTVTWSSSNPSVATVSQIGRITGVSEGTAVITATANGDSTKTATCTVNVITINKEMNAILWDNQSAYFAGFNTNNIPSWNPLHNEGIDSPALHSAFMSGANTLSAGSLDLDYATSALFTVNRSDYSLSYVGENYAWMTDMAPASSIYTDYMVYSSGAYLAMGSMIPEDDGNEEYYTGIPLALLGLGDGDVFIVGVTAKELGELESSYYFLDERGRVWETTLVLGEECYFTDPVLVLETGVNTYFLFQSLYYDGTYLYWAHAGNNYAELIIIRMSDGEIFYAGGFGEDTWPICGLYVNGTVAPNLSVNGQSSKLDCERVNITRDEMMNADTMAKFKAQAKELSGIAGKKAPAGGLNRITDVRTVANSITPAEISDPEYGDEEDVLIQISDTQDVFNGLITIEYDTDELIFTGLDNDAEYCSYKDDNGLIRLAFADKHNAVFAGRPVAALHFERKCNDSIVTVSTIERNGDLALSEIDSKTVSGCGHEWEFESFTWVGNDDDGYTAATANFVCTKDASHTMTMDAVITVQHDGNVCEESGEIVYIATVELDGNTYEDVKKIRLNAIGHDYGTPTYEWTETASGYSVTATSVCANDPSHIITETVTATYAVTVQPTDTTPGTGVYTATFANSMFTTQTREVEIPATGGGDGHHIIVVDKTKGKATTSISADTLYSGDVTFTVACDLVCTVALMTGNDTYTVLKCTTSGNTHSYTVTVGGADVEIIVVVKGDANLDAKLSSVDATFIKQASIGNRTLGIVNFIAADFDKNNRISSLDALRCIQVVAGSNSYAW